MKTATFLLFLLGAVVPATARELLPERWFENVPAMDDSVQQCLVFRTVPGVLYTIQRSDALSSWQQVDTIYGLGHEIPVPMREFTPPPPPPDPQNPPAAPDPGQSVSLMLRRSSAPEGGTIVSWRSLEHGSAMMALIDGEMHPDWDAIPVFAARHGDYDFLVTHPGGAIPPPGPSLPLGSADAAMLAELENSLPAMNQSVADSVAASRLAPPPAPPAPDSRSFWRIKADWSLDTDGDGSPDWIEFELAALGPDVNGLRGDPYDPDTDNNGQPDGEQLDGDDDGVPDSDDTNPGDPTVTDEFAAPPRYAMFPITTAEPPADRPWAIQISDKGTVLYENGTWATGKWTKLPTGDYWRVFARAINDNNEIIGSGSSESAGHRVCWWAAPNAAPSTLEVPDGWNSPARDLGREWRGSGIQVYGGSGISRARHELHGRRTGAPSRPAALAHRGAGWLEFRVGGPHLPPSWSRRLALGRLSGRELS